MKNLSGEKKTVKADSKFIRPYTDFYSDDGSCVFRKYNYPGGRKELIKRAIDWRGFTKEEAERQYPEIISSLSL